MDDFKTLSKSTFKPNYLCILFCFILNRSHSVDLFFFFFRFRKSLFHLFPLSCIEDTEVSRITMKIQQPQGISVKREGKESSGSHMCTIVGLKAHQTTNSFEI